MILLIADSRLSLLKSALAGCSRTICSIELHSPAFPDTFDLHLNDHDLQIVVIDCLGGETECLNSLHTTKKRRPDVPVIFVVSSGSNKVMEKAMRLGARECFKKPFDREQFKERVAMLRKLKNETRERRAPFSLPGSPFLESPLISMNIPKGIVRAIAFLEDHVVDRNLSIKRVARVAGMSPFHFCRTFKRHTSLTPMQFLVQKRLDLARTLLKNASRDMTISRIATDVGFYDSSNFNKHFKRDAGVTPSDYRQAVRPAQT